MRYHESLDYLQWASDIPWQAKANNNVQVSEIIQMLNAKHYGLDEIKQKSLDNLGKYIDLTMQFISSVREIDDLPESQSYRMQNNLHRYFDQVKEYQSMMQSIENNELA